MSLPEVLLVLREDHRREATRALLNLQTEALAAFAVWDKEAGRKLESLRRLLSNQTEPIVQATSQDLEKIFAGWGVQDKFKS